MHHIKILQLGPIQSCELDIDQFIVLTGPQASGKSTIAKAIFYFRTIKDDILDLILRSNNENEINNVKWKIRIIKYLRNKFLRTFGTSWAMPLNMTIQYQYSSSSYINVSLKKDMTHDDPNYVYFDLSSNILEYLGQLDSLTTDSISHEFRQEEMRKLSMLFDDDFETVFIPAGRSMITLLTDQINYIYTTMDEYQKRAIDYCTQTYIERILKLKPSFSNGLAGFLSDKLHLTQEKVDNARAQKALNLIKKILKGSYVYSGNEERLMLSSDKYVKINFASSGQQETVWILNILFYYLVENKRINLIIEEPESHLYPDSQKNIADLLGLFSNAGNPMLVTTHSPYILGEFNNLLYANEIPHSCEKKASEILDSDLLLPYENMQAFHVKNGYCEDGMDGHPGLIRNELIDGASIEINTLNELLMNLKFQEKDLL